VEQVKGPTGGPPPLYPLFVKLEALDVLVVGAGRVGARKVRGLVRSGARVTVVAPDAEDEVVRMADAGSVTWHARPFQDVDVEGVRLVFAATPSRQVNEAVAAASRAAGLWVNVADVPDLCSFYLPAVVRRDPLQVAISTTGASPAFARTLRERLERELPERTAGFVTLLGEMREEVRERAPDRVMEASLAMVRSEAESLWREGDEEGARRALRLIVEST